MLGELHHVREEALLAPNSHEYIVIEKKGKN